MVEIYFTGPGGNDFCFFFFNIEAIFLQIFGETLKSFKQFHSIGIGNGCFNSRNLLSEVCRIFQYMKSVDRSASAMSGKPSFIASFNPHSTNQIIRKTVLKLTHNFKGYNTHFIFVVCLKW